MLKRVFWSVNAGIFLFITIAAGQVYRFAERDEARPADAAIVLGAAVWRGRPSPVLRERINHAVQLYQQGTVSTLIFTGGIGSRDTISEAEAAANYALQLGVPADVILIETTSTNTRENLANARAVAQGRDLESFLIVSTPYHMKRALAIAADLGLDAYSSPTRTTRWLNRATQTRAYVREVVAYAAYLMGIG